jgi:demethylmenaquinone methyltransferase/2-methoxy-6-polyprenyl-1,4-benzoquinol methylase
MQEVKVDLAREKFFDQLSDSWDTNGPSPEPEVVLPFLQKLNIDSDKTVLDVGTGTGLLIPHIFSFHPVRVIAMDLSARMLSILRGKYSSRFGARLEILHGDVHLLNLHNATVDIAVCNGVYPHFHDKLLALSQLQRVLKKGGILAVNHFASRQFINSIHRSSSHDLIRQDLLGPAIILSETIAGCGFHVKEWRDDSTEFYLIAEKR